MSYQTKYSAQLTEFPMRLGDRPRYNAVTVLCFDRSSSLIMRIELPNLNGVVASTVRSVDEQLVHDITLLPWRRVLTTSNGWTTSVDATPATNPEVVSIHDCEIWPTRGISVRTRFIKFSLRFQLCSFLMGTQRKRYVAEEVKTVNCIAIITTT